MSYGRIQPVLLIVMLGGMLAFALVSPPAVHACSRIAGETPEAALQRADVVFSGKVGNVNRMFTWIGSQVRVRFDLTQV